jgi:hypothetical protein
MKKPILANVVFISTIVSAFLFASSALSQPPNHSNDLPVLIVPDIFASWSRDLFCGSDEAIDNIERWLRRKRIIRRSDEVPSQWTIDPIRRSYKELRSSLRQAGISTKDVPYDWRMRIQDIATDHLIPAIDDAKNSYGVEMVDVVAHGMGGLIVRSYIQSDGYANDIRNFAMIGVPHRGSVEIYPTWEGGNFYKQVILAPPIMERVLENMKVGCGWEGEHDAVFIREEIPSVGQLMPTFPHIKRTFSKNYVPVDEMCLWNNFLPDLNSGIDELISSGVRMKILASKSKKTIRRIGVSWDQSCSNMIWPDGKPKSKKKRDGDQSVLLWESAYPYEAIPEMLQIPMEKVKGKHHKLPNKKKVRKEVLEFLLSPIQGLSRVDFSFVWDTWDSDPEGDGVTVNIQYFDKFNGSISFHDKPIDVVIEFWTQKITEGTLEPTKDELILSFPVVVDFSDAVIRVPIDTYEEVLAANFPTFPEESVPLWVVVRVFPPQADPMPELAAFYSNSVVYEPPPVGPLPPLPPPGPP